VARLWEPRVSPRREHKFHERGEVYHGEGNMCDTLVGGHSAAEATDKRTRATDERTDKQMDITTA